MPRFLRRTLKLLATLLGLVALALLVVHFASSRRLARRWEVTPAPVVIPTDAAAREEGLRLYFTRGCADCHGDDLGGRTVIDDPLMGTIAGANLTTGTHGIGDRSDSDLIRAMRHGLAPDGRGLVFMPSHEFNPLANAEIGAMIAAIRAAAPVDRQNPAARPGPLMRALFVTARHHADPDAVEDIVFTVKESLPVLGAVTLLSVSVAPSWASGSVAAAGFIAGYLVYEWVHAAAHSPALRARYPRLARRSELHARHHHERPKGCYGFVTSLWDRVLGTYHPPRPPSASRRPS